MAAQASAANAPASNGARRRLRLLAIVVVLFMSWAVYTLFLQYHQSSVRAAQLHEAKDKLATAQLKSDSLKKEIQRLNDPEYIGQIARKEQGMGLPGEQSIQVQK